MPVGMARLVALALVVLALLCGTTHGFAGVGPRRAVSAVRVSQQAGAAGASRRALLTTASAAAVDASAAVAPASSTSYYQISPWVVVAQAGIDAALFGKRLLTHTRLPYYLMLFTAYSLLRDAEKRNRLDKSTFKILGLATGWSAMWLLCSVGLSPPVMLLVGQNFIATRRHGLPWPKINLLSPSPAQDPLPALYLASIFPAVMSARPEMAAAIPLVSGALLALHSAALAGSPRLASETYKKLNAMLVMFFAGAAVARKAPLRLLFAAPFMLGLLRGSLPAAAAAAAAAAALPPADKKAAP